jgi:hypothetical protein
VPRDPNSGIGEFLSRGGRSIGLPMTSTAQAMRAFFAACASAATFTSRRARMPRCHAVEPSARERALRMICIV